MKLYEYEAKLLLAKHGIDIPRGIEIDASTMALLNEWMEFPVVVKAQVLSGKRNKQGGIEFAETREDAVRCADAMLNRTIAGQKVDRIRVEEKVDTTQEFYLSFTYDTRSRMPMILCSDRGGVDIEDAAAENESVIRKIMIDPRSPFSPEQVQAGLGDMVLDEADMRGLAEKIANIYEVFSQEDMRLLEINPLSKTADGKWVALDAKAALDEDAYSRHPEWASYSLRTLFGRAPNARERSVKKIDEGVFYYRGTASKYIEMDGDIAVMFSGGGASLVCMDALFAAGGKPANYTEYSGNPPREKVRDLARVVLSKPGLRGLWIAGGFANFTRIDETFAGIIDAFEEMRPTYPIVVRRAGPFDTEGEQMMKDAAARLGLDLTYFDRFTPMTETAAVLMEKVRAHEQGGSI